MGILQILRMEFRKFRILEILNFHPCTIHLSYLQIISQHAFKDGWLGVILTKFVPELLKYLQEEYPLDVKYTACCVFRALAHYEEFIVHITDVILPTIIMMRNSSAKFKVSAMFYIDSYIACLYEVQEVL